MTTVVEPSLGAEVKGHDRAWWEQPSKGQALGGVIFSHTILALPVVQLPLSSQSVLSQSLRESWATLFQCRSLRVPAGSDCPRLAAAFPSWSRHCFAVLWYRKRTVVFCQTSSRGTNLLLEVPFVAADSSAHFPLANSVIFWILHESSFFKLSIGIDNQIPWSPVNFPLSLRFPLSTWPAGKQEQPWGFIFTWSQYF